VILSIASSKSLYFAAFLPSLIAINIAVLIIFLISAPVNPVVIFAKDLADTPLAIEI